MQKFKLAIVTGTRAEYGLLRPVINECLKLDEVEVRLVVTGAHLSDEFGNTQSEIIADGFEIAQRIPILKFGTGTAYQTAKTMAYTMDKFTDYLSENRPDAILVLGDRYEIFACCSAATALEVPVVHISGGDVTHGALDDCYRHCITKMAALHFPSCEQYANRVISMGEQPQTVHNVGGLGDENIRKLKLLTKEELAKSIEFDTEKPYLLLTYHPETAHGELPEVQFEKLLNALKSYDIGCVFTKANADAGGVKINELIDNACEANNRYISFTSMGVLRYLSAMKYCSAVVGNSSSGVVETPTFGVPCINIGTRQKGRIICDNVINCSADEISIGKALEKALSSEFGKATRLVKSPFEKKGTSFEIARLTLEFLKGDTINKPKEFYDA